MEPNISNPIRKSAKHVQQWELEGEHTVTTSVSQHTCNTLEAACQWQVDEQTSGFRFFISELQEILYRLCLTVEMKLPNYKHTVWQGKPLCISF